MSALGHSINAGLVAVIVVVVAGTVGATLYYQHSVDRLDDRADALSDRTQTLERNLTATHADLRTAKERERELNRSLAVAKSDVATLSERLEERRSRNDASEVLTESTESEDRSTPVDDGRDDLGRESTTAAPTPTPDGAGEGDAWQDGPRGDESWDDGSWDDGLVDDGGYGDDDACARETGDPSDRTAACEG